MGIKLQVYTNFDFCAVLYTDDDQRIILGAAVAGSSSSDSQTATDYINASYINVRMST